MDDQQQFCLRWNDFQTNMVASFKHLRDEKSFCDVTLACKPDLKLPFDPNINYFFSVKATDRAARLTR